MPIEMAEFTQEGDETYSFNIDGTEHTLSENEAHGVICIIASVLSEDPHDHVTLSKGDDNPIRLRTVGEPGYDAERVGYTVSKARQKAMAMLLAAGDVEQLSVEVSE